MLHKWWPKNHLHWLHSHLHLFQWAFGQFSQILRMNKWIDNENVNSIRFFCSLKISRPIISPNKADKISVPKAALICIHTLHIHTFLMQLLENQRNTHILTRIWWLCKNPNIFLFKEMIVWILSMKMQFETYAVNARKPVFSLHLYGGVGKIRINVSILKSSSIFF